jgi:para-nitrobenzyl esterase
VTEAGTVHGSWQGDVATFLGVPFAAPPVGPDRWRPPGPVPRWSGARAALSYGAAPVQPLPRRNSIMFHANFADRRTLTMSEDCLYLNVWTPSPSAGTALPVMVWVHGGGNRFGYGSQDIHDASSLARRGVVVVTLNYRLGALGFLAHPGLSAETGDGTSGNYGLMDVVAALEWVGANIEGFGGDPGRVTAAGNSAGSALVCHLMAAPSARGLFTRVIGQSSSGIFRADGPMTSLTEAEARGQDYAASLSAPDVASLRQLSALEVTAVGHFAPVVDGRLLTSDSQPVFGSGQQAAVPLLVGSNRDEGSVYARPADSEVVRRLAEDDHDFRRVYPVEDEQSRRLSARSYVGDSRFVWPVWRWAMAQASLAPTWVYRFEREPPLPEGLDLMPPPDGAAGYGVFHSAELPYTWDNLETRPWPWTDVDRELARTMADAWVRFIDTGDPNGGDLAAWPALQPGAEPRVMQFAETSGPAAPYRADAMALLDRRHLAR